MCFTAYKKSWVHMGNARKFRLHNIALNESSEEVVWHGCDTDRIRIFIIIHIAFQSKPDKTLAVYNILISSNRSIPNYCVYIGCDHGLQELVDTLMVLLGFLNQSIGLYNRREGHFCFDFMARMSAQMALNVRKGVMMLTCSVIVASV